MKLENYILVSLMVGALMAGVIVSVILYFLKNHFKKGNEAILAKEFKQQKELYAIIDNLKMLNKHLQLENHETAQALDMFKISQSEIENFIIAQKAQRKELTEKEKKKATKYKF